VLGLFITVAIGFQRLLLIPQRYTPWVN
jgi:hypothetical protein